jgi:restriction system protein
MRLSWWAPQFEGEVFPEHEVSKIVGPYTGQLVERIFKRVKSEALPVEPEITLDVVAPAYIELYNYMGQAERRELVLLPQPSLLIISSWEEIASRIAQDSATLHQLGWKQFEDFIAHLLSKFGWSVEPMGYTKDKGIDIIAVRKVEPDIDFRMMVQCKRYAATHKVGVEIVRELWAVKWEKSFHQAMIATTSSFTKGAVEKANIWDLELKDHVAIIGWCKKYGEVLSLKKI